MNKIKVTPEDFTELIKELMDFETLRPYIIYDSEKKKLCPVKSYNGSDILVCDSEIIDKIIENLLLSKFSDTDAIFKGYCQKIFLVVAQDERFELEGEN